MKWRPISELSDEQRDGKSWLFSRKDDLLFDLFGVSAEPMRWSKEDNDWLDDGGSSYTKGIDEHFSHFLSEPLPDFPKPLKMEWRRFEDETPQEDQKILVFHEDDNDVYKSTGGKGYEKYHEAYTHWMPIITPEDKE